MRIFCLVLALLAGYSISKFDMKNWSCFKENYAGPDDGNLCKEGINKCMKVGFQGCQEILSKNKDDPTTYRCISY
jgi:hypothetical protein